MHDVVGERNKQSCHMHDVILGCETICRTLNLHDSISVAGTLKINCTFKKLYLYFKVLE